MDVGAETYQRMQRVRIGLTGLAFVFVLVLLATILVRRPSEEAPLSANAIEQQSSQRAGGGNAMGEPQEPLAELGVAPGNAETNTSNSNAGRAAGPARQP
jgi:predicted lipid-binding transport protein (Tim44 family)